MGRGVSGFMELSVVYGVCFDFVLWRHCHVANVDRGLGIAVGNCFLRDDVLIHTRTGNSMPCLPCDAELLGTLDGQNAWIIRHDGYPSSLFIFALICFPFSHYYLWGSPVHFAIWFCHVACLLSVSYWTNVFSWSGNQPQSSGVSCQEAYVTLHRPGPG